MPQSKQRHREWAREWRARNPSKVKAARSKYLSSPSARAKARAYAKVYYSSHDQKNKKRLSKYGLTLEQFNALAAAQDHRCASCKDRCSKLVVDHDHVTGQVRALLCHGCNTGIGMFKEDPSRLLAAIRYLQKHQLQVESKTEAAPLAANPQPTPTGV